MNRVRTQLTLIAAVLAAFAIAPASALAVDVPLEQRTLFLSERFSPSSIRGPLPNQDVVPQQLLTLRGEREGFQLAVNNSTGAALDLQGRVAPDDAFAAASRAGTLDVELLRVAFTNLSRASSRVESRTTAPDAYKPGTYADALPPLRNDRPNGRLAIPAGQWGGVAMIAKIRTDAAPGIYGGNLELFVPGPNGETVYARQPFTIEVRNNTLLQGGAKGSFKTVMRVEGEAYWLQDNAMRNGAFLNFPTEANRMLQLQGLVSFLDSRGVTLTEQPFGAPNSSGRYSCAYSSHKSLPTFAFLDQVKQRYFGQARDIDPGAQQFPVRMFPAETTGCDQDSTRDDYAPKVDKYRTPTVKQDDLLHPGAAKFFTNIARTWTSQGLFGKQTYVKNPFDEPSDRTARMRAQYTKEVPKANTVLHKALGKRAKVVLADWPRDERMTRACRKVPNGKVCTNLSGDGFSNRKMWDGRGTDDVDVWLAPFSRLFGRPVPNNVRTKFKVTREDEYSTRLAKIKKLRGGREVWAYNFYTGNAMQPQLTIDAPATDPRMNYWLLAREGHTGLYVSNTILGWGTTEQKNKRTGTRRKGNPWDGATYFEHQTYGAAAGWGTFLYPGYRPALGLDSEDDRNTANARPVTTLRMEGMRDGQEDANLMQMYRSAKGATAVSRITKPIFPGTFRNLPRKLGNVMTPTYNNGRDLAQRIERQRRAMIRAVAP